MPGVNLFNMDIALKLVLVQCQTVKGKHRTLNLENKVKNKYSRPPEKDPRTKTPKQTKCKALEDVLLKITALGLSWCSCI